MINLRRTKSIYTKELVDLLRDHRTLLAMVVVPIVLYPALMLGGIQVLSTQTAKLHDAQFTVGFQSKSDWEDVVRPMLDQEASVLELEREKARADGASEAELAEFQKPVIELIDPNVTGQLEVAVRSRQVHCGVVVASVETHGPNREKQFRIRLLYQPEDLRSQLAADRLDRAFERVAEHEVQRRLRARQVDPVVIEPVIVEQKALTSAGSVLGLIVPLILVLMTITGAIYPAIDVTAGERERGTLESLMVCPVPVIDLICGKFLVVSTIAIMGAALNLGSVTVTVFLGGFEQVLNLNDADGSGGFPFWALPVVLACLVPLAVLMSAVMIAVCSCARTFKEAQNYVLPVILAALFPGGIAALPGTRLEGVNLVMPVGNMVLLTRELLSGAHVPAASYAWVLLSTCLYAAAAVALAANVFGRESVLFAESVSLRAIFNRKLFKRSDRPTLSAAALYAAILFPIWFHVQNLLQLSSDDAVSGALYGTAILLPILFVGAPILAMQFWRVDTQNTLRIRFPAFRFVLGGALIGLTAWIPASELFVFQDAYLGSPPALDAMNKAMDAGLAKLGFWIALVCLAIVPGICEELFFRGFLLSAALKKMRPWPAILMSAAIFGVFHFFIFRFFVTAGLGVVLGMLCWRSRSIWPGVIAHMLHNGLATCTAFNPQWRQRIGIVEVDKWPVHLPTHVILIGSIIFVTGIALSWPAAKSEVDSS